MSQKNASPDCFSGQKTNIARGTTDPGYRVFSLNYLVDLIEFVSFLDNSIAWVHCATT